jgi:hypothetical protein
MPRSCRIMSTLLPRLRFRRAALVASLSGFQPGRPWAAKLASVSASSVPASTR